MRDDSSSSEYRSTFNVQRSTGLIAPYGGNLVDLLVAPETLDDLTERANRLPSIQISARALCDLELLATGAFSPLDRFMGEEDYHSVLENTRLVDGSLSPIPITLPVHRDRNTEVGKELALRDSKNNLLATIQIEEVYRWDLQEYARKVCDTLDPRHPMVAEMHRWGDRFISGPLRVLQLPVHHDFRELRLTPAQTRARLEEFKVPDVVAFQTRNPLHRVHEELTKRAVEEVNGTLLLHPVVGMTKSGDVDHYTRVRTYKALAAKYYDAERVLLSLLPLAMRFAGPKEALWHALIRRNYGANHLIVGRSHASPGVDSKGEPFYGLHAAQEFVSEFANELGVKVIAFRDVVYLPEEDRYEESSRVPAGVKTTPVSSTQVREQYLNGGKTLPHWVTRPEVADILTETHPPRHKQGVCIWFTGLSGAGKSTTAEVLATLLMEHGRQVTVLDGDVVRTHLSKGLGFSKVDRDTNIRRIGFVAAEIARHGGTVICAAVSPYRATRNDARNMVGTDLFVEVFVDTPIEVCEQRDIKGLYAKARRGEIKDFTGVDDPYEPPEDPEITLETVEYSPEQNAVTILDYLIENGFIVSVDG
jgi:sulfate adenylyltransferase